MINKTAVIKTFYRFFVIVLAVIFLFSLAACGQQSSSSVSKEDSTDKVSTLSAASEDRVKEDSTDPVSTLSGASMSVVNSLLDGRVGVKKGEPFGKREIGKFLTVAYDCLALTRLSVENEEDLKQASVSDYKEVYLVIDGKIHSFEIPPVEKSLELTGAQNYFDSHMLDIVLYEKNVIAYGNQLGYARLKQEDQKFYYPSGLISFAEHQDLITMVKDDPEEKIVRVPVIMDGAQTLDGIPKTFTIKVIDGMWKIVDKEDNKFANAKFEKNDDAVKIVTDPSSEE